MVMYPEVREYQKKKAFLSSPEKSEIATKIMEGFRAKGNIPGVYRPIWETYERRLKLYKSRLAKLSQPDQRASEDSELLTRPITAGPQHRGR